MDYYTSDTHYGHVNILAYTDRKNHFSTLEEMGEALVARYNKVVGKDDRCFFIGDIVMGLREENLERYISRLNGHKILIAGNHDHCHSMYKKHQQWMPKYAKYFEEIHEKLELPNYLGGIDTIMHHFPYKGSAIEDHGEVRYENLRLVDEGKILLHGHIHHPSHRTGENMFHVGVDAELWNYAPVSKEMLESLL